MHSPKPCFFAGEVILCPKCLRPQVQLTCDIYVGQVFSSEMLALPEGSQFKPYFKAPTLSWCCSIAWGLNGALFTEKRGWRPYNPYPSEHSMTEQDRYLARKKTII